MEAFHQFQAKCFIPISQIIGKCLRFSNLVYEFCAIPKFLILKSGKNTGGRKYKN